jgi:hypothetical protein
MELTSILSFRRSEAGMEICTIVQGERGIFHFIVSYLGYVCNHGNIPNAKGTFVVAGYVYLH